MSTFDSTKSQLSGLLNEIVEGKLQLPDFQRGWVWDDDHIRSLLVSIARSFPIGAVMLLDTGGATRFQIRPVEGVELGRNADQLAEQLILDGQQRLTSLTQVLKLSKPVATRDARRRDIKVHYYIDITRALEGPEHLASAIIAVDENKQVRSDFGRVVDLDLSTVENEIDAFMFPCTQILVSDEWENVLMSRRQDKFAEFMKFRQQVVQPFRNYMLPVITLRKETSKEAVCLVFEKVNTGGVPLSVFELVTATWAADGYNLRDDWYGGRGHAGRKNRLAKKALLKELQPTDFLQAVSLLHTFEVREGAQASGKSGKDLPAVSAKREHVLETPLSAYQKWCEPVTVGFEEAAKFLRREGFHQHKFLPYRSQLVPLAAVIARIGTRWMEPQISEKLSRWFWCGVLGELYGGSVESQIALDLQQLMAWIHDTDAPEPATVQSAIFNPNRLDTLRSRTSAAYRGLYVLVQREGARDFFWKSTIKDLEHDDVNIDIHHIFPKKWCADRGIPPRVFNAIVNKTAISYRANRKIGGYAPSSYLQKIQEEPHVQLADAEMNGILASHLIDPEFLRADDFEAFYAARKASLVALVERVIGKVGTEAEVADDDIDDAHDD